MAAAGTKMANVRSPRRVYVLCCKTYSSSRKGAYLGLRNFGDQLSCELALQSAEQHDVARDSSARHSEPLAIAGPVEVPDPVPVGREVCELSRGAAVERLNPEVRLSARFNVCERPTVWRPASAWPHWRKRLPGRAGLDI